MGKSDYTYEMQSHQGYAILVIEDLDQGGMSVTNNIENVVEEISLMEQVKITPDSHIIIYLDSDGLWTGWHMTKGFLPITPDAESWITAASYYLLKHNSSHE